MGRAAALGLALLLWAAWIRPAQAWGALGHEAIALVAESLLQPDVRRRVDAILAADTDPLTAHDIASAATWADTYRQADMDGSRTRKWHYVDIALDAPSLDAACFRHVPLPPGTLASLGPANSCVVDKIAQFAAELADPDTQPDEQVLALKFLLHFVGDVHQPLHAADDDDRGGNEKRVFAPGLRAGNLHHFWDTEAVRLLGSNPRQIARSLLSQVPPAQMRSWARGTARDWALESFAIARDQAYGQLPPPSRRGNYELTGRYIDMAARDARLQLARAGVRLAFVLNRTLGRPRG